MPDPLRIQIVSSARNELKAIARFTRQRWGAARRDRYMADIDKALRLLADVPLIGEVRDDLAPEVRLFPCARHFIAYRVRPGELQVLGFPHQSMDLPAYFEE